MPDLLGLRVLVIEPDWPLASVLVDALTLAGAQVVDVCADLAEAARGFGPENVQALIVGTRHRQDATSVILSAQAWGLPFLLTCDKRVELGSVQARCLSKPFCFRDLVDGLNSATHREDP